MELFDVVSVDTIAHEVTNPETGDKLPGVVFVLAGPQHPKRVTWRKKVDRALFRHFNKTGKPQLLDPDERDEKDTEFLVISTLDWKGVKRDGVDIPFSADAVRDLYTDPKRAWLRAQIAEVLGESSRFLQVSPGN